MSDMEMMRGKALLLNLNNARIRFSRARDEGADNVKELAHEVSRLQAMWREHLRRCAPVHPLPLLVPEAPVTPLAA